jgi:uncharacterized sporulation protein YeaH/YhbH (DUF444 family)
VSTPEFCLPLSIERNIQFPAPPHSTLSQCVLKNSLGDSIDRSSRGDNGREGGDNIGDKGDGGGDGDDGDGDSGGDGEGDGECSVGNKTPNDFKAHITPVDVYFFA